MSEEKSGNVEIWNYFSSTWDTMPSKSKGKQLEQFHKEETKYIKELIRKGNFKIADFGCGLGDILKEFDNGKYELFGLDFSPMMLKEAKKKVKNAIFLEQDITKKTPFENDKFDYIICTGNTLGNVEEPEKIAKEIYRVLKPKGIAIFGVYNGEFLNFEFVNDYYAKLHKHYGYAFPFHLVEFSKSKSTVKYREGLFSHWFKELELKKMLYLAGFNSVRIIKKGIGFIVECQK